MGLTLSPHPARLTKLVEYYPSRGLTNSFTKQNDPPSGNCFSPWRVIVCYSGDSTKKKHRNALPNSPWDVHQPRHNLRWNALGTQEKHESWEVSGANLKAVRWTVWECASNHMCHGQNMMYGIMGYGIQSHPSLRILRWSNPIPRWPSAFYHSDMGIAMWYSERSRETLQMTHSCVWRSMARQCWRKFDDRAGAFAGIWPGGQLLVLKTSGNKQCMP